jgi:hypothetical protein
MDWRILSGMSIGKESVMIGRRGMRVLRKLSGRSDEVGRKVRIRRGQGQAGS